MKRQYTRRIFSGLVLCLLALSAEPTRAEPPKGVRQLAASAQEAFEEARRAHEQGRGDVEAVYTWSRRWRDAALDAAGEDVKKRLAARRGHVDRMSALKASVTALVQGGQSEAADISKTNYYLLEAIQQTTP